MKRSQVSAIPSLNKFKIPAILIILLIFALVFTDSISRAAFVNFPYLPIFVGFLYAILYAAIAIFFMIAGYRILKALGGANRNSHQPESKDEKGVTKRKNNLKRVSSLIVLCAASMLASALFFVAYGLFTDQSANGDYALWWLIFSSEIGVSLTLILVFKRPVRDRSTGSGSSTGSKTTTTKLDTSGNVPNTNGLNDSQVPITQTSTTIVVDPEEDVSESASDSDKSSSTNSSYSQKRTFVDLPTLSTDSTYGQV